LPFASYHLANIDQAHANNMYATELSGNGLFTLAAAMRRNELNYERFYKTIPQAVADKTLAALGVMRLPLATILNGAKHHSFLPPDVHEPEELGPFTRRPKNVVLITVESLSAEYLGAYGSTQNLTPRLDQIAKEGLQFDKLFATGTRTVRGLDALSIGIPPIPGQAIVHRQHNDHLATVGEFLEAQGFATMFIYGGYGYFDNMNAYFRGNDYRVIDRTDFDDSTIASENIWGVADESLFDNTLKVLDQTVASGKPFFTHIMTTSNHRPYTFPDGRIDLPQGHREGAVKYTDYAIGRFIEQAKAKPWFKDTLFVIVADHCASVAGKTQLPVDKYHIPLIFYAPDMLKPGHYTRIASQIDVPPTLLDLLGAKGDDHFFGQSLFEAQHEPARAFISNYQELGYYKNDTLTVLSPKRQVEAFAIDPVTYEAKPRSIDRVLEQEAIAYYQTSSVAYKRGVLKEHADGF
jgi:phosphoglycerol transferase MdoB-like AlkP superfamily enzyme